MRHSLGLAMVAAFALAAAGCGASPGEELANRLYTPLPNHVTVEKFDREAFSGRRLFWILSPVRQEFLDSLIANDSLQPAKEGQALANPGGGFPDWWDPTTIRQLPELYFRNPGLVDRAIHQVWVDRQDDKIYILYVDTRRPER